MKRSDIFAFLLYPHITGLRMCFHFVTFLDIFTISSRINKVISYLKSDHKNLNNWIWSTVITFVAFFIRIFNFFLILKLNHLTFFPYYWNKRYLKYILNFWTSQTKWQPMPSLCPTIFGVFFRVVHRAPLTATSSLVLLVRN